MTDISDALLLHLKQSGFVDPGDGTVALFQGSFAVGEDSVTPIVWTSAETLVDAVLARFELTDRQAERVDGIDVRERPDGGYDARCRTCGWSSTDSVPTRPDGHGGWEVDHVCPRTRR